LQSVLICIGISQHDNDATGLTSYDEMEDLFRKIFAKMLKGI